MDSSYKAQYPLDHDINPAVVQFLENFYQVSDTPDATDQYVDLFTQDATLILASKTAKGHQEIRTLREGMWATVASRKHQVSKVYPFGNGAEEVMLHGQVTLGLKAGGSINIDWAGRTEFEKCPSDGKYRMKFYQIYLDTGATAAYKK